MRELKFRRWNYRDTDGKWLCSCYQLKDILEYDGYGGEYDDYIWEQYTGLKDKNGKEIYDGDIVKLLNAPAVKDKALIVKFDEFYIGEYSCNRMTGWIIQVMNGEWISSLADENANCEVIGNIHENKELLK